MDALMRVRILGPAKLGGRWLKAGDELEVTPEEKTALQAAGLVAVDNPQDLEHIEASHFTVENWQASVDKRAREMAGELEASVEKRAQELAGAAFDGELGRMEAELKSIEAAFEKDQAILTARATAAEAERDEWKAQVTVLQSRLRQIDAVDADKTPPGDKPDAEHADAPPEAKAAKTTPKKGAAATTKG